MAPWPVGVTQDAVVGAGLLWAGLAWAGLVWAGLEEDDVVRVVVLSWPGCDGVEKRCVGLSGWASGCEEVAAVTDPPAGAAEAGTPLVGAAVALEGVVLPEPPVEPAASATAGVEP